MAKRLTALEEKMGVKRRRTCSLDKLPEIALPDVVWASKALEENRLPQMEILADLNQRLADHGLDLKISKSAFSRYAVRRVMTLNPLKESSKLISEVYRSLELDKIDESTLALVEFLKKLLFDAYQPGQKLSPDDVMKLSRALRDLISAQKIPLDRKRAIEKEAVENCVKALDKTSSTTGLSPETTKSIKEALLGAIA